MIVKFSWVYHFCITYLLVYTVGHFWEGVVVIQLQRWPYFVTVEACLN